VIEVSSLKDSGPGSLREALSTRGPRIIRFTVEGTIELRSPLVVIEGRVTIDSGTASGNGVILLNQGIHFRGDCKDIIVRHLRIRVKAGGSSAIACCSGARMVGPSSGCFCRTLLAHGRHRRECQHLGQCPGCHLPMDDHRRGLSG
jgi:hypothetical protein